MSIEDHDVSNHLVAASKAPYSKEPWGRVVMYVTTAFPKLRPFKGVLLQYLSRMDACIHAEGNQAVSRYKAYKLMFLEVVGSGFLPDRKFKHAMPIYRLAMTFRSDPSSLMGLMTVMRYYDLFTPPQSKIDADLEKFNNDFIVANLSDQQHSYSVTVEDGVFDFKAEIRSVTSTRAFKQFALNVPFHDAFRPQEKAILLARHGTARFSKRVYPKRVKGFAPAIAGATAELRRAHLLRLRTGESYYDLLASLANAIGGASLPTMSFKETELPPEGALTATLRRTVGFGNPGFKTRVIAIGDYTTQYVLSPLHSWAFNVLRRVTSDYTFDHTKGFRALSEFTRDKSYVACFDLSNATDALPVTLSECVLAEVCPNGQVIAPLWRRVLTEIPFEKGYYRVGQPMGLMSSWSVGLALTHHFIVWIAARRAGILQRVLGNPKGYYGIVGDDIFICHPQLAFWYSNIMNALGVKINLGKSLLVSSEKRIAEFVKRNSYAGDEITALSPKVIVKSYSDYTCLRELMLYARNRTLIGPGADSASSFDEKALVDLYKGFGSKFIRSAIGTMCTIPTIYAGLSELSSDIPQWPPRLRIRFLAEKALVLLEYSMHSLYIGGTGQDLYNDLVLWSLEDLVPEPYFPKTPFMEYLRKQGTESHRLFSEVDVEQNHLMAELSSKAFEVITSDASEESYSLWEHDFLQRLSSFAKPDTFKSVEATRAETRSLAFKIFDLANKDGGSPSYSDIRRRLSHRLKHLLKKFSFELPAHSSIEEMYSNLFSEELPGVDSA